MASRATERSPIGAVGRVTVVVLLSLSVLALLYVRSAHAEYIATYFFIEQDMPALLVVVGLALLILAAARARAWAARLGAAMTALERSPVWAMAAFVALVGVTGCFAVFAQYPLSMDEFWARADGLIFAHGEPMAHISREWLPYGSALQPIFLQLLPDAGVWSSRYLPVNALMQLALGPLASPLLAGVSVVLVAAIARQLMPEHRTAPAVCALLLASSSQLLITAMTPYAMSAHLAFNLAWLWLFLKRGPAAQVGAMAVGFLATGLHQLIFFPLFALPFVAEAFFSGHRRWPIAHGVVIAAGALAWSNYDSLAVAMMGVTAAPGAERDAGQAVGRMLAGLSGFGADSVEVMGLNLLRFQLWQNPLAVPLALVAAPAVIRGGGPLRAAAGGIVLVTLVVLVVQSFQGHGWGFRYLHGELGSVALLATCGWYRMVDSDRGTWRALFASMLLVAILALLPLRAYQAWHQAAPYVAADRALQHVDADVVVIDAPDHAYTWDLARNSPLLDNRPKRMAGFRLDDQQLAVLCERYRVSFFTDADAERFGIHRFDRIADAAPRACPR